MGPQRHGKLPLWELNSEEWNEYAGEAEEVVRAALEKVPDVEHARRLRAIEEALMVLARRLLNRRQEQRGAQRARLQMNRRLLMNMSLSSFIYSYSYS